MEVDEDMLEKRISFWISNGVLRRSNSGESFSIVEKLKSSTSYDKLPSFEPTNETSVSLNAQRAKELKVFTLRLYKTCSFDY